jgi:hypothetical protein
VRLLLLLLVMGCAAAPRPTVTMPPKPTVLPAVLPGWLAFTPAPEDHKKLPHWIPVDANVKLLIPGESTPELPAGQELLAVPVVGSAVPATVQGPSSIRYGCNTDPLDVLALDTATRLPPGVSWLLPAALPAGWAPAGLPVVDGPIGRDRRGWTAGPLAFELVKRARFEATFMVRIGDKQVLSLPAKKHLMEGAGNEPLDLSLSWDIGMPAPVGVFRAAPGGPYLVVLLIHGYEGFSLGSLLVRDDGPAGVIETERLNASLYFCAF